MTATTARRPRFTLAAEGDDDDAESEQELSPVRRSPVPAIRVDDATAKPNKGEERDLDREERHVGFAKSSSVMGTASGELLATPAEEKRPADEGRRGRHGAGKAAYPPLPQTLSSSRENGDSKLGGEGEPEKKEEKEQDRKKERGFDRPEFADEPETTPPAARRRLPPLPGFLAWIKPHMNWKGWRPVIRASIAAWCGLLLMLCDASLRQLGQASFLVLIVATIIAIAHAARSTWSFSQSDFQTYAAERYGQAGMSASDVQRAIQEGIFHGDFIEPAASALWLRGYLGPGPALFGCIFAMILIIISLTIGNLMPYPYYSIGWIFFLPFTCQQAVILACTLLIFPETLAHQFADRLIAALQPLHKVVQDQKRMLAADPRTSEWLEFKSIQAGANAANAAIALMTQSESNLSREISFARVNGRDLSAILQNMRVLAARTSGFAFFYTVVEKHLHREDSAAKGGPAADDLVIHLGRSRNNSPSHTPSSSRPVSRPASPSRERRDSSHAPDPAVLGQALDRVKEGEVQDSQSPATSPSTHAPSPLSPLPRFGRAHSTPAFRDHDESSASFTDSDVHPTSTRDHEGDSRASISNGAHSEHHRHHLPHHVGHPMHHAHTHSVGSTRFSSSSPRDKRKRSRSRNRHGKGGSSSHISLPSLLHELDVKPVGVVESMTYADLEDYLHNPRDEEHLEELMRLLSKASTDLISVLATSVAHLISTIHRFKSLDDTYRAFFRPNSDEIDRLIATSKTQLDELKRVLAEYRDTRRLEVVKPFAKLFDPYGSDGRASEVDDEDLQSPPSHRGLFWAFQYQHSLLGWGEALVELFETVLKLETKRRRPSAAADQYGEDDPEELRDINTRAFSAPRDPDYKPPKNLTQYIGVKVARFADLLTRPDVLFGIKSAVLLGLCSLVAMFPSTAWFFYHNRGVWVLVMICLTSNQYLGDVTFGFLVRVFGTIAGAAVGLLLWSIAAQTGKGNPFAVGAVCAVAFPFIFFYRVHMMPPMTAILPSITIMLVLGYSWQVIGRMGDVICQILSYANCKEGPTKAPKVIVKNLAALRQRVNRTVQARAMAREMLDQLGQLCGVISRLDDKWTKALLHHHGTPLPFIYNPLLERFLRAPEVVASGHAYGYGYEVQLGDDEVEGLPTHVNLETICSLEYLRFSAGVSQAYAIINRLDRLMFVAKSLVGENYILYGLESHRQQQHQHEETQGLLHEHLHGPDSRRTSFDRNDTM
ncbi:hypothetical protein Rhopal_003437-T1 [Rhodotorula paludigena]|uniref:ER transporter 6TM N-terminal domain-containing protein n=1 Tax=Rhodotorula paludigena TaxID=86838 RepID=A0AAV5GD56_9BASI|nr:hypothetical protein Rhopal_003437-T1 [Rhodotorula paludigena]